jgi:hypothetical protein
MYRSSVCGVADGFSGDQKLDSAVLLPSGRVVVGGHRQSVAEAGSTDCSGRSRPAAVLSRETPDHPLRNTTEVSTLLGETINQVRRGVLDPRVANCMGQLLNVLLRSLEQGPLEERLARLEASLGIAKDPHAAASGKDSLPV